MSASVIRFLAVFSATLAALLSLPASAMTIRVVSAIDAAQVIAHAKVTWQQRDGSVVTVFSDDQGWAEAPTPVRNDPSTTLSIEQAGYATRTEKCACDDQTYALSPVLHEMGSVRIVLSWGVNVDGMGAWLDAGGTLIGPGQAVGDGVRLDVAGPDGPSTLTFSSLKAGQRYVYAVHQSSGSHLRESDARVDVYIGRSRVYTYYARRNDTANTWVVFGIDGDGMMRDINRYLDTDDVHATLNGVLAEGEFKNYAGVNPHFRRDAAAANARGEALYPRHKLNEAMRAFQTAIQLDPQNGQAYSNLGLGYQTLGFDAEALWAYRKAIEFAAGDNRETVQAGSYCNIARIHEAAGQWQQALEAYRKARALKASQACDAGIARMQQKLQSH